ncbi:ABC transporter ATP-binding protein [uncultured Leifsonia sp.]|uniref:ABC transporter ATP-binding protein n=1 Tax=uncultured Leifsonia sp. TaxID=340359 RepID=UPI0025E982DB|nr:ABC transporter ATP-binding protein [uncultured Leifsonia sp.]
MTPLPTRPVLQATALTKAYGSAVALDGVEVHIAAGESVAIMGASGSGKTTLLDCLAGIVRPDSGAVVLNAPGGPVEVTALRESERSRLRRETFGFVFQQGLLLPELTAVENVALPLMLSGTPRSTAEASAAEWLGRLGLAGLEGRRIGELSGGQAQRVAIARSQVTGAAVVFADEPTGALDSSTSAEVMAALIASTTGNGRSLVVVTHDDEVARQCARVLRLSDGRIVDEAVTR